MLTSIATVSISGNLESKLRAIAKARFDGVEIFENDLLTSTASAREVAALMRDLGLKCTLFQPFRDFEGMPDQLRPRIFERIERKFDLMQELGANLLLVCSNVSPAALGDRKRIVNDFRELGERAAKRNLRVGYEALAWGRHVYDHRDAWSIVREVDHSSVGLILDSFHSLARNIPNESLREIDPKRVFIVQLADAPVVQMDYLSWSRHLRNMPGQGDLPIVDFVTTLLERGYDGFLSLEIFNDRFRSTSASTVAVDGHRALTFLYDQVARRLAPIMTPEIPPRARVRGVEFVEFAANEEEAPKLGDLFGRLGFTPTGRHRNKDVTRWRQNGINFVFNAEPDSFARAYDAMHGASVCALGLSVENLRAPCGARKGCKSAASRSRWDRENSSFRPFTPSEAVCSISWRPGTKVDLGQRVRDGARASLRWRSRTATCGPHRADDAARGDVVLAAVLLLALRCYQGTARRRSRIPLGLVQTQALIRQMAGCA